MMNEEMKKAMAGKAMPELAIVDNNTLAALGLKGLLESVVPMVKISIFGTFGVDFVDYLRKSQSCLWEKPASYDTAKNYDDCHYDEWVHLQLGDCKYHQYDRNDDESKQ